MFTIKNGENAKFHSFSSTVFPFTQVFLYSLFIHLFLTFFLFLFLPSWASSSFSFTYCTLIHNILNCGAYYAKVHLERCYKGRHFIFFYVNAFCFRIPTDHQYSTCATSPNLKCVVLIHLLRMSLGLFIKSLKCRKMCGINRRVGVISAETGTQRATYWIAPPLFYEN